ncbi:DUF1080 domain-containing protein [Pedobacter aquae]|uniref:DUF1080 domain-containing protein n=1 Tax=Pedobacter aquae TaxID=2605747 RepID=A0A5C0VKA5_9SPHI|nr:DUF1080 domain-containing protein [Pedobacter aquae]QEK52272.1 DUF1080 domain-containing protein [Pedobacter aquae]
MRSILTFMLVLLVTLSCKSQKVKANKGWENLLANGTQDWHTYGKAETGAAWTVEDGVLHFKPVADKAQRGDLATDKDYANFHLKLEWKVAKNANSGIMFNVLEDAKKYPQPYLTGPEMQVLDNDGHPDAKIFKHRAGDLYDLIPCSKETVKPAGEWNKAEIISNNGKLEFYLNGVKVVSTTMWDDAWNKMVAASKFKSMPDFGKFKSGKIVLQDHGDEVWFKNIMIKAL